MTDDQQCGLPLGRSVSDTISHAETLPSGDVVNRYSERMEVQLVPELRLAREPY